jgi:hypothetical protein
VNEIVDDVDYGSSKVELAYKKGKIDKAKYDELMSKKGQFDEESVNEEEMPENPEDYKKQPGYVTEKRK